MKYDLSKVVFTDKMVIHCDTEEKANALLAELDSRGFVWWSGKKELNEDNCWEARKAETCYKIYLQEKDVSSGIKISFYKDSITPFLDLLTNQRKFSTGAVRDNATGKGRFDLMPMFAVHKLAKKCEDGAIHYGERNVDKGIPQHSLVDSGMRHLIQYIRGDQDEEHLVSALWNIAWAVEQDEARPQMNDLPWAEGLK